MRVGNLRHIVEILEPVPTANAFGEEVVTWGLYAKAFAEVKPLKAAEFFSARGTEHQLTHRIIMRYIAGVEPDMRVRHDGRDFEIFGVRDYMERKTTMEILCKEIANG